MDTLPEEIHGTVDGEKMTKKTYENLVHSWRRGSDLCAKIFGLPKLDSRTVYYPYPERDGDGHACQRIKKIPFPDFKELV